MDSMTQIIALHVTPELQQTADGNAHDPLAGPEHQMSIIEEGSAA